MLFVSKAEIKKFGIFSNEAVLKGLLVHTYEGKIKKNIDFKPLIDVIV